MSGWPATLRIIGSTNVADADGDPVTVTAVSSPAHGIATATTTNATYTATNNFTGTDSFNYTVRDNFGGAATNVVTGSVIANSAHLSRLACSASDGNVVMTFLGIPWNNYILDRTLTLSPPV